MSEILRRNIAYRKVYREAVMLNGRRITGQGHMCSLCFLPADFEIPATYRGQEPLTLCVNCARRHLRERRENAGNTQRSGLLIDPDARLRGIVLDG